jgi:pyrroline-5-carboxylate reductase
METITLIGNGNMALSIAKGLKKNYNIEVVGRDPQKLNTFEEALGVTIQKSPLQNFNSEGKTLLLCVKPNHRQEVSKQLQGRAKLIISVLAGVSIETLKKTFNANQTVRAMPNLAASLGASMTTLTGDNEAKEEALTLLSAIGSTLWLNTEKEIDIATALAGSGPAYLTLIAEALADGAVKQGLKRNDAMQVMRGLFDGFGQLIQTDHPALIKDNVMSPGGTTAAGYSALENGNVRATCIQAIEEAYQKAIELKSSS